MSTAVQAPPAHRPGRQSVRPTGVERTFAADELIVSKTDTRGVITYANDVFLRVSGYGLEQVMGQPHNLIRHPDMPKAVFRLLWDTLAAGHELFAYIDNLAADGANYWVLAHVTPSYGPDGTVVGYHSNRRSPSPRAIARVRPLYAQLLAEERRHGNGRAAVEASSRLLDQLVAQQAASYEEFIWSVVSGEEQ
ncbi:PAS domain-containing protein [Modestobacter versicolor]|uniref:Aerotaxis receptor Aer n=1 Tax=Modestobacter versicolor TaxID=429133 RepID=A0A323V9M5_9ACTN|nr:PAS domain-containing protein [Modestobacter versicolor]MBB3677757.1 PAS domain S-box-containing protein [Modestobacter versicolor]PZA21532.1 aerotaxis receptor Aer [Modestobacter versicolor]